MTDLETHLSVIDDEPTAGSDNLVKSGGVLNYIRNSTNNVYNLFDKTKVTSGWIDNSDGKHKSGNSYRITDYIPITTDGLFINIKQTNANPNIGWACYSDRNESAFNNHSGNISQQQIVYQEGDKYARFTIYAPRLEDQIMITNGTTDDSPDTYIPYNSFVFRKIIIKETNIQNGAVSFEKISFTETYEGTNKLNPKTIQEGKYINRTNGVVASWEGYAATDFIKVSINGLYCKYGSKSGTVIGSAIYDSDKNFLRQNSSGSVYNYADGDAYVRFSLLNYDLSDAYIIEGTSPGEYEPYYKNTYIDKNFIPPVTISNSEFLSYLNSNSIFTNSIEVFLPDKIYAIVGDTLQLFFQSMSKCVEINNYNTLVVCDKGSQYYRYFQYTPVSNETGSYNFKFYIKDNNRNTLGYGTSTIIVANKPQSPTKAINILCVGDSITAGGVWPSEFMRRLSNTDGTPAGDGLNNINFVGSNIKDSTHYEGHSGYSWGDYATQGRAAFRFVLSNISNVSINAIYSNNNHNYTVIEINDNTIRCSASSFDDTPSPSGTLTKISGSGDETLSYSSYSNDSRNPFWDSDNNKLSFAKYANSYCNGSIDVIYILLGANGLFGDYIQHTRTFIDAFHVDFPNGKIKLMGLYVPSMKLMMPGYGASGYYADTYNVKCALKDQAKQYQSLANEDEYSSFVEFLDVACQLDSDYNFPTKEKQVNTRNETTEPYANNTIHASPNSGYLQIADVAYRNFVATFCQN